MNVSLVVRPHRPWWARRRLVLTGRAWKRPLPARPNGRLR